MGRRRGIVTAAKVTTKRNIGGVGEAAALKLVLERNLRLSCLFEPNSVIIRRFAKGVEPDDAANGQDGNTV